MTEFTPFLALAAFVFACMEIFKAATNRDWLNVYRRLAVIVFAFVGSILAAYSSFASEIQIGPDHTFADIGIVDALLLAPTIGGLAMATYELIASRRSPTVVNVAEPAMPSTPGVLPTSDPAPNVTAPKSAAKSTSKVEAKGS